MSEERITKLEYKQETLESLTRQMAENQKDMVGEFKKINAILQEQVLNDTRVHARIDKLETNITAQIQGNNAAISRAHERTDKIDAIITRLAWTVISVVIIGMMGAVLKFGV